MNPVYMDHNATTPVRPEVAAVLNRYLGPAFGNPNTAAIFEAPDIAQSDDISIDLG